MTADCGLEHSYVLLPPDSGFVNFLTKVQPDNKLFWGSSQQSIKLSGCHDSMAPKSKSNVQDVRRGPIPEIGGSILSKYYAIANYSIADIWSIKEDEQRANSNVDV